MSESLKEKPNAEELPRTAGPGVIREGHYMRRRRPMATANCGSGERC